MVYLFDKEAMTGGGTCPAAWTWSACVEEQARIAGVAPTASAARTCTATPEHPCSAGLEAVA
jgi:hypothetical protein